MARTCDSCGESFETLSSLRLHDCPDEGGLVEDALLPEPKPDEMPDEVIDKEQFEELKNDARISRVEKMLDMPLPGDREAISIVVEIDGYSYGLHCDHDTAEWAIVAEGPDYEEVKEKHMGWLSEDIGEVTGDAPSPDFLDSLDVPDKIRKDCDMCDGSHELTAQPDSFPSSMGLMEYEGVCDETGHPIIITKDPDELLE
ncbi:hypothetical protein [Halosimplex amylolyticum]|uniref:hypothetical protein n=1 Tax=Halosimplex amylolyticum TaxID=3396616 RepID=UPI003F55956D